MTQGSIKELLHNSLESLGTQPFIMASAHRAVGICSLNPRCQKGEGEGELGGRTGDFFSFCLLSRFSFSLLLFYKVIWMVTFTSAIFLGLDIGLLVSVAFAFILITVQSHRYLVSGNRRLATAGEATIT